MKKAIYLLLGILLMMPVAGFSQGNSEVTFSVSVENIPGNYAPRHVLAIWVEDKSGNYINSLAVYGDRRLRYLSTWNDVTGGDKADAVTGATVSSFRTYSVRWDLKDHDGNVVSDGTYVMRMEATSQNGSGPKKNIDFEVGGDSYSSNPEGDTYYKNMVLEFTNKDASLVSFISDNPEIKCYPNPVKETINLDISLAKPVFASINLIDLTGRYAAGIFKGYIHSGENVLRISRDPYLKKGTYFLQFETKAFSWTQKIVLE